ncbi:GntR family transcriptional regulator [Halomonas salipaludis]|uniref:GntR family transcriptional regulator n=1 Tax=Halomonas salipaludis TaxID=2032625 RepID=A0A2A2ENL6_9GAMM|nr:GntR family transcriptional regulator [Halomonas salipaludis]PAU74084.1 GntR family transcriptional regulator [Halomonas salipaludis]
MKEGNRLVKRAYRCAKQAILCGKYGPGEALFESHLATDLGMSRTPVREALQLLAREGFVEANPARGYLVPRFTAEDMRELFEVRESLEGMATRAAALYASNAEIEKLERICDEYEAAKNDVDTWTKLGAEFHSRIIDASRNRRLAIILDSLKDQIMLCRRSSFQGGQYRRDDALREHLAILNAIKSGDGDAAEQHARIHVRHSHEAALRSFSRHFDPSSLQKNP